MRCSDLDLQQKIINQSKIENKFQLETFKFIITREKRDQFKKKSDKYVRDM